jgi:hypothetical protein
MLYGEVFALFDPYKTHNWNIWEEDTIFNFKSGGANCNH